MAKSQSPASKSPSNNIEFWGPEGPVLVVRLDKSPVTIEAAEGIEVSEAAKAVLEAVSGMIEEKIRSRG
jgi:hypothetical protein